MYSVPFVSFHSISDLFIVCLLRWELWTTMSENFASLRVGNNEAAINKITQKLQTSLTHVTNKTTRLFQFIVNATKTLWDLPQKCAHPRRVCCFWHINRYKIYSKRNVLKTAIISNTAVKLFQTKSSYRSTASFRNVCNYLVLRSSFS